MLAILRDCDVRIGGFGYCSDSVVEVAIQDLMIRNCTKGREPGSQESGTLLQALLYIIPLIRPPFDPVAREDRW